MKASENPYASPEAANQSSHPTGPTERSRLYSAMVGGGIGFGVAFLFSLTFGALCHGVVGSLVLNVPGFVLIGGVVGAVRISPEFTGAGSGLALYLAWVALTGPNDGWIFLVLFVMGGSGFFCGGFIGLLFRIWHASLSRADSTESDQGVDS